MDEIDTDAEFLGSEFEQGEVMALGGRSLPDTLARLAGELGRDLTGDEAAQVRFGWHVGRADYEAAQEREAERQRAGEPLPVTDWTGIPY